MYFQAALSSLTLPDVRTRKPLTAEQLELRKKKREETMKKRKAEVCVELLSLFS